MSAGCRKLLLAAVLLTMSACTTHTLKDYPSLVDRGVLPLSSTNPYLGTNLFLSDEFSKSTELFNFLKGRGAPSAIEIKESGVDRPTVRMFYTGDKQVYIAELQDSEYGREWIVRGPFAINRQEFKGLPRENSFAQAEPVFMFEGREYRFREPVVQEPPKIVSLKVPEPPKRKKTAPKPSSSSPAPVIKAEGNVVITADAKAGSGTSSAPSGPVVGHNPPMNLDQQALQMAKDKPAAKGSEGDVIHAAKSGQTVKEIVQWYCGSTENADEIAKRNGVKATDPLPDGKEIVIPAVLVRETKQMP